MAIFILMVSWALPLGLAVASAFRDHWMRAAAVLTVFAIPHQLMGLTSTCTQGSDGTFGTGAIVSGPLLLVAVGLTWWALHRRKVDPSASWVTLAVPLILLILTRGAWVNTLQHGTPCGEEFAWYGGSAPTMVTLILSGYLVLPLLLAISAAGCVMMTRRPPGVASN